MIPCMKPKGPIPEPLRGLEIGTFTNESIVVRLPDIARRTLAENVFPPTAVAALETLMAEIPGGLMRQLTDSSAPDAAEWKGYVEPYQGQNWLQVPWFFAEAYFYRRVLEATGYFQPGPGREFDPFANQKQRGLQTSRQAIGRLGSQLGALLETKGRTREVFSRMLVGDLWGNQADLSLWPADNDEQPSRQELDQGDGRMLVDETRAVVNCFLDRQTDMVRVDFLLDNAGFELVVDLFMAAFLLHHGLCKIVYMNVKAHPTFVSDATIVDVEQTISSLAGFEQTEVSSAGRRLKGYLDAGRLRIQTHAFWTSPLEMWKMPDSLRRELAQSDLLISKGDANYRRLVGDRHWPFTTPLDDIACYVPAPLVVLRTLKSEVAAGLQPGQADSLSQREPTWMIDGRWGMIQFVDPRE